MRLLWVGIVVCLCATCAALPALGQQVNRGEVESIGIENYYRPDAWTPMVVRLNTNGLETGTYQLQVIQEDLDRDRPHYTRTITVDASQSVQRFWMYFLPKPTDRGLPDTLTDLRRALKVQLCTDKGKPIAQLPLTSTALNVDPVGSELRGAKLIVGVSGGDARPRWGDFDPLGRGVTPAATGVLEDVYDVTVRPAALPENPIGYEGVDAVVWFDANADELDAGGARRTAALEQWVRGGGKLVVCTPSEPARLAALARLLPVELVDPKNPAARLEVRETEQPEPLRSIVRSYLERTTTVWREARPVLDTPTWDTLKGPFQFARATPKPRAVADDDFPIYWDDQGKDRTPFVVRWPYGLGSVTWVATNLGDGRLTGRTVGWSAIWTEVMGWNLVPLPGTRGQEIERQASFPYGSGARKLDLGASLLSSVEHGGKQATLVSLVVVFFIVYWLAAGPGSYLLLANKGRKNASWPAFALAAMVATGLTVLVTRLVLQGDPVARHWTLVQQAPGQPAVVTSRVGLYVPASTYQTVGLANAAEGVTSYVAPWPRNFHFNRDDDDAPPAQDYVVPVPDPAEAGGDEAAAAVEPVSFPYRSTNKVLAARWAGDAAGLLGGQPTFGGTSLSGIAGTMTNTAGRDLADVYFAFRNERGDVWLLYTPLWKNGQAIDLATAFHPGAAKRVGLTGGDAEGTPGGRDNLFGRIWSPGREQEDWLNYWYAGIRNEQDVQYKDERDGFRRSFPMLSFFDLLAPVRTAQNDRNRVELLRRGGRQFDLSHAVTAGQMVVIGRTDATAPLPVPLVVEGSPPAGQGTTFYQWVVPLDRPKPVATTQENVEVRMPNVE